MKKIRIKGKKSEFKEQLHLIRFHEISVALYRWVSENGLMLKLKKTNIMIFCKSELSNNARLQDRGTKIKSQSGMKFLGVIVDEKLTWSHHIATVKSKMSRYIGIMYKIKHKIPLKVRIQIYHSFVQSHLNYCSLVWGFAAKSHIESLLSKQKRSPRNHAWTVDMSITFIMIERYQLIQNVVFKNTGY